MLHKRDNESDLWSELDLITDLDVLPLAQDAIAAVDVAADQILEPVVAVEATPPLA